MSRLHFSLGTLLLAVLSAGVAFAALRSPSDTWASALFTLAVALLLVATLRAVHRRDHIRAYWLGFALFGWAYLILSLVPETTPRLATTGLLDALFARVHGHTGEVVSADFLRQGRRLSQRGGGLKSVPSVAFSDGKRLVTLGGGFTSVRVWDVSTGRPLSVASADPEGFRQVGHSLLALLIACVGGRVSLHLHEARDRQPSEPPEGGDPLRAPIPVARTSMVQGEFRGDPIRLSTEPRPGNAAR